MSAFACGPTEWPHRRDSYARLGPETVPLAEQPWHRALHRAVRFRDRASSLPCCWACRDRGRRGRPGHHRRTAVTGTVRASRAARTHRSAKLSRRRPRVLQSELALANGEDVTVVELLRCHDWIMVQ